MLVVSLANAEESTLGDRLEEISRPPLRDVERLGDMSETEMLLRDVDALEEILEETELLVLRDVVRFEEILGETEMLGDVDTLEDILE